MSLLVKENVAEESSNVKYEQIQWHDAFEWLAITSLTSEKTAEVNFFKQNGRKSIYSSLSNKDSQVAALSWHPKSCWVAVGWNNGKVTLKDLQNNKENTFQIGDDCVDKICSVLWHTNESVLLIADQASHLSIQHIDNQLTAVEVKMHRITGNAITVACCSWGDPSSINTLNSATDTDLQSSFIYGSNSNGLYAVSMRSKPEKIFDTDCPVVKILPLASSKTIVCLTEDINVLQLSITSNCTVKELKKVEFSGMWPNCDIIDVCGDEVVFCNNTKELHIWKPKVDSSDTLILREDCGYKSDSTITCISYSRQKGVSDGKLAIWNKVEDPANPIRKWKLNEAYDIGRKPNQIKWSAVTAKLAICGENSVTVLLEQTVLSQVKQNIALVQFDTRNFLLVQLDSYILSHLSVQIQVCGMFVGRQHIIVWDREQVVIYEVTLGNRSISTKSCAGFRCNVAAAAVYQDYVIAMEQDRLSIRTFQGTVKQVISLPDAEGFPVILDVVVPWMCLGTSAGYLRTYELNAKEAVQRFNAKYIKENFDNFASFVNVQMNSEGNRVCFTYVGTNDDMISTNIVIWDAETDSIISFDLATGMTDVQTTEAEQNIQKRLMGAGLKKIGKGKERFRLTNYLPGECQWDLEDSRVLVCEANCTTNKADSNYLITMFVTSEHGIQVHDMQKRSPKADILIGVNVPLIYSTKKTDCDEVTSEEEKCYGRFLLVESLKEFSGFECTDKATKKAMINFSFYLTIGRIDAAFKEIKFIKSDKVWEHMALMCFKTQRIDVALICLGNMGNACGARAIREAIESGEPQELQLAYLAIQLELYGEAISLFKSCGRYDLINKLHQSKDDWKKAFEVAKEYDRIHLRNTHYLYALSLEANEDVDGAIKHFEISHTHYEEVPRLLINNSKKLENYVKKNQDLKMKKWWAQYLESHGDTDSALRFYRQGSDYLSVVRLLCRDKKIEEAKQVAESCNDNAACYHLARYYENESDAKNAVYFFAKAHAYNSAIRIAKENRMTDQLANMALMAGESDMLEAARFYEKIPGQTDKAVMLYHKGGMIGKAMELAFETKQFTALNLIAKDLNESSEPRILERAASFYAKTQQYTSALKLLACAKNYDAAIKFCMEYNVPLDESTAELITPSKSVINNVTKWRQMVEEIAKCCVVQGNYYSAAKKYTQAGNKIEAMRCLLKTGNTEKIIFFANTARNRDIYILAANYLQTLDWKNNENVLNNIVLLYSRSSAFEHLTGFYEACAKAEIDDYRNYEKGYLALNEAQRCLMKALEKDPTKGQRLNGQNEELRKAIMNVKKFIMLQSTFDGDPFDAVRQVEALLRDDNRCKYIHSGDLYSILIVHNVRTENYKKAYALVKELQQKEPGIDVKRYVNSKILDKICLETGNPRLVEKEPEEIEEETGVATVDYSYALKRRQSSDAGSAED